VARDLYGELDLNGNKIVGVAAGVSATDAVNKSQLDGHAHAASNMGVWTYDTATTAVDPGAGRVRTNAATGALSTAIYISQTTVNAIDAAFVLGALATGDLIAVQEADNGANWARFEVSGAPTDNGAWFTIPVTYKESAGIEVAKNQDVLIRFTYGGGGGGGIGAEMEVQVQNIEPTPVVGMDIWIDPDAPDWNGGIGGVGGPSNAPPPAIAVASAIGISEDYAREDHTHAGALSSHTHGEGDLPSTLATDAEVSSAVGAHLSGANHVALASTTPAPLGAAAAVGDGLTSARDNHVHIRPTPAEIGASATGHTHVEGDLPATLATDAEVSTAVSNHLSGANHVALASVAPVALAGTAAVGVGTTAARDNHVHPTTGLSLTGHTHGEGDLPSTLATDTEVSNAVSTHNSGSPHVALTATLPSALGVAAVGNGSASARDNHVHAMPTAVQVGAAPTSHSHVEGDLPATLATDAEVTSAISTHNSGSPHVALTSNLPAALGTAAAGNGTTAARDNHVHAMPSAANVGAAPTVHTHAAADTNSGTFAIALIPTGTTGTTVALGNHTHTQAQSHGTPDTDAGTTSLHHTIGTSATQAAAGNHTHATPTLDHGANLVGLADDDHIQYGIIVVSATEPATPRVGTIWVPSG